MDDFNPDELLQQQSNPPASLTKKNKSADGPAGKSPAPVVTDPNHPFHFAKTAQLCKKEIRAQQKYLAKHNIAPQ